MGVKTQSGQRARFQSICFYHSTFSDFSPKCSTFVFILKFLHMLIFSGHNLGMLQTYAMSSLCTLCAPYAVWYYTKTECFDLKHETIQPGSVHEIDASVINIYVNIYICEDFDISRTAYGAERMLVSNKKPKQYLRGRAYTRAYESLKTCRRLSHNGWHFTIS